jgi:hypothetical protein
MEDDLQCRMCGAFIAAARWDLNYRTCLDCVTWRQLRFAVRGVFLHHTSKVRCSSRLSLRVRRRRVSTTREG